MIHLAAFTRYDKIGLKSGNIVDIFKAADDWKPGKMDQLVYVFTKITKDQFEEYRDYCQPDALTASGEKSANWKASQKGVAWGDLVSEAAKEGKTITAATIKGDKPITDVYDLTKASILKDTKDVVNATGAVKDPNETASGTITYGTGGDFATFKLAAEDIAATVTGAINGNAVSDSAVETSIAIDPDCAGHLITFDNKGYTLTWSVDGHMFQVGGSEPLTASGGGFVFANFKIVDSLETRANTANAFMVTSYSGSINNYTYKWRQEKCTGYSPITTGAGALRWVYGYDGEAQMEIQDCLFQGFKYGVWPRNVNAYGYCKIHNTTICGVSISGILEAEDAEEIHDCLLYDCDTSCISNAPTSLLRTVCDDATGNVQVANIDTLMESTTYADGAAWQRPLSTSSDLEIAEEHEDILGVTGSYVGAKNAKVEATGTIGRGYIHTGMGATI